MNWKDPLTNDNVDLTGLCNVGKIYAIGISNTCIIPQYEYCFWQMVSEEAIMLWKLQLSNKTPTRNN